MADPRHVEGIPDPLDGDDDDVAWALQTAAVEWRRAAHDDALTWLRRAATAAMEAGHAPRAAFLEAAADRLARPPARGWPGTSRPPGSAAEVEVEVDDDDGLETIDGLDEIGGTEVDGRGVVPHLPPLPSPPVPPVPGAPARLPPLPPPPARPSPPMAPPPMAPPGAPPPPVVSRRPTPAATAQPSSSAVPGRRGSVLSSIAHPPEERDRPHEPLPPHPGGHDSGVGLPPSSGPGSYLPGVLGAGRPAGAERVPSAIPGSRGAALRPERPPLARRPSDVAQVRRAERSPERPGPGAPASPRPSERSSAAPSPGSRALPRAPERAPAPPPGRHEEAAPGPHPTGSDRRGRRGGAVDRPGSPPPDSSPTRRETSPPAFEGEVPELPAQHPEAELRAAQSVEPEVSLPLVHEPGFATTGAGAEAEEDHALPAPSVPEPSQSTPLEPAASDEEAGDDGEGGPDLPDIDAEVIASATASLIPDAPRFDDEEEFEEFPPAAQATPAPAEDRAGSVEPTEPSVLGVRLSSVRGLQDLSIDSQQVLARRAKLEVLQPEEEISSFAVALVVKGDVGIVPAVSDIPCGYAQKGDVVFTRGSLAGGIALSVVAGPDGAAVAAWDQAALDAALGDSPWVGDELLEVADRFQAMAGATMGPLGQRLDESLMASVFAKAEVRLLYAGDPLVEAGRPVQGLAVVGAGRIEVVGEDGKLHELHPGDLVFPGATLSSGPAPAAARAGAGGALVLQVGRHETHELMVSVPPLLEVLASA